MTNTPRRRTLITGGASGLGAALVAMCTDRGHEVVVVDRNSVPTAQGVESVVADLGHVDEAVAAVADATSRLGGLDVLVNAAGINTPALAQDLDPHYVARMVDINLTGAMTTTLAALDHLVRSRGRAVFIGSTVTRRGNVGQAGYAATKHGLAGFVHSLGYELRGQVGLTLIEPGAIDTALFEGRDPEWVPAKDIRMSVETVAAATMFAIEQPPEVSIRELLITHNDAPDWP